MNLGLVGSRKYTHNTFLQEVGVLSYICDNNFAVCHRKAVRLLQLHTELKSANVYLNEFV